MKLINQILEKIRQLVRTVMGLVAKLLDKLSGGHLTPNMVTISCLAIHLPIAYFIATKHLMTAALLLLVFGVLDTLDGQLARVQQRESHLGMLLDATSDRMKEIFLYCGTAWYMVATGRPYATFWVVAACGGSLLVSYVKAKAETAVKDLPLSTTEINRLFVDGTMRYEVRMIVFFLGLFSGWLLWSVILIAISSWFTALNRLIKVNRRLAGYGKN